MEDVRMLTRIIALARRISPGMNQTLVRLWYHYLAIADKEAHLLFMNYGYADLQPDAEALALNEVDERGSSSMCWRLYSAIIHGNWHLFIKRLQEYWRSRCKNSRRREEQERLRHLRHVSSHEMRNEYEQASREREREREASKRANNDV